MVLRMPQVTIKGPATLFSKSVCGFFENHLAEPFSRGGRGGLVVGLIERKNRFLLKTKINILHALRPGGLGGYRHMRHWQSMLLVVTFAKKR